MRLFTIALLALPIVSACVPAQDQRGAVVAANGKTVTIVGPGDFSLANAGKGFKPTAGIVAQAQEICPNARYLSGTGSADNTFTVSYLFLCP